ncbi:MAG: hypothetical protein IPO15_01595 [Anaerolineae bacterium]|uniref:hypothetical protein n=1 Tax=Candidatus Amarolinea dominans TaxID=3140696 RepID=UPI0031371A3E|nr:hypothetical protein [Anaerolineae bacterium]
MTAIMDPTATLGPNVTLGEYVVIEAGASLGAGVTLGHHVVVHAGAIIGDGTWVGDHGVGATAGRRPPAQWGRRPTCRPCRSGRLHHRDRRGRVTAERRSAKKR